MVSRFVDRLGAPTLAERIRVAVAHHTFDLDVPLHQTCSIGFASFPFLEAHPDEFVWQEVVGVADRALYTAKENGRNGWVGVSGIVSEPVEGQSDRVREDFSGCVSRGEIQCQTSQPHGESEAADAEKDESA